MYKNVLQIRSMQNLYFFIHNKAIIIPQKHTWTNYMEAMLTLHFHYMAIKVTETMMPHGHFLYHHHHHTLLYFVH